jgi:hypothetical protein
MFLIHDADQSRVQIWAVRETYGHGPVWEFLVYGLTQSGDPKVYPSLAMACEIVGAHPQPILETAPFLSSSKGPDPMPKLTDTQAIILSAAAQRDKGIALPLPQSLRGGAAAKVVGAMLAKGLLEEIDADLRKGEPVWRETGDGHGVTLIATNAGLAAIGIEPEDANTAPAGASDAPTGEPAPDIAAEPKAAPKTRAPRTGTKQAKLIEMLRAEGGATIEEIATALAWRSHTVRGTIAGALKKKLGLEVTSEKVPERGRVYRLKLAQSLEN